MSGLDDAPAEPSRRPHRRPWRWLGLLLSVLVCAVAALCFYWVKSAGSPEEVMARYGLWAPLGALPLHIVVAISPLPSELFVVAEGATFGWLGGTILGWIGWTSASVGEYLLARRTSLDFNLDKHAQRLPTWLRRLPVGHPAFLICVRWMPAGFHIVNILAGTQSVPLGRHTLCAAIGSLPTAALFSAAGAGLVHWL